MRSLKSFRHAIAAGLALVVATGGVMMTPSTASALTAAETATVNLSESEGGYSSSGERTIFTDSTFSFDQFDPALGTLTSATLSWDLTANPSKASNNYDGRAHLDFGGKSDSVYMNSSGGPFVIDFADNTAVTTGHIGTGTFVPSDLVGRVTGHTGTFPWGASFVVTGTITMTYVYSVGDTTDPTVTVPADITSEATSAAGATVSYSASFSDNVAVTSSGCTPASGGTFPLGTTTITCTATDAAGNTGSDTFTITVQDTTNPTVTVPSDITSEATSAAGATVSYSASFSDNVAVTSSGCTPASGGTFPLGTTTITCTATDAAGNTGSDTFTITVQDTTDPNITTPTNITSEATSPSGATVSYAGQTFSDNVAVTTSGCTPASGGTFPLGTTTITCTATDAAGNSGSDTFTITVQDTTDPTITTPTNITSEATSPSGATVSYAGQTFADIVGVTSSGCTPASGGTFPLGTTTITCTATDAAGNTGSDTFTITVQDTSDPSGSIIAPATVEATGPSGASVDFTVDATDNDGIATITCSPESGDTFPIGTTTITCAITDNSSNTIDRTADVTVEDTTDPTITVPSDIVAEATSPAGASVAYTPSFADAVGVTTSGCTPAPGTTFPIGTTTVTCTATDAADNNTTDTFTITVEDTTDPTVTVPSDIVAEATSPAGASVAYTPSFADAVGVTTSGCTPAPGATFPIGTTTVTCTATDAADNNTTDTFTITVEDTTDPSGTIIAPATVEATGPAGAPVDFTVDASDADGIDTIDCTPAPGATFPIGTTTISCTITDNSSNTIDRTADVTVQDTSPPAITVPDDIVSEATGTTGNTIAYTPLFADAVGVATSGCTPASGTTFPIGTTTITCTATDAADNTTTDTFTITIQDTTNPTITTPDDIIAEATGSAGSTITYAGQTFTDIVGVATSGCTPASGTTFPIGTTTITCTATDAADNTTTDTFTITIQDTTNPTITTPDDIIAEATSPAGAIVEFDVGATDVAGVDNVECTEVSGSVFPRGSTDVECTATDRSGNQTTDTFEVTVVDTTAPSIGTDPATAQQSASLPLGLSSGPVNYDLPLATDAGGDVEVACTPAPGSTFAVGRHQVSCTARDAAGNASEFTFSLTVSSPPGPTLPATGGSPQIWALLATAMLLGGAALTRTTKRSGQ